jgi:hypothetical protein
MLTFFALVSIVLAALVIAAIVAFIAFVLKLIFWVVFFPIRLIGKLLFGLAGATLGLVLLPLVVILGGIALVGLVVAAIIAVLTPLLPVLLVALVGWAIYRTSSRSALRVR